MSSSDEFIYDLTNSIGNLYVQVNNAIGDSKTPGSFNFELTQLAQLCSKQLPQFGIIGTPITGFTVSPSNNDSRFVTVTQGIVGYNGKKYSIPTQSVEIFRTFGYTYDSNYRYGAVIGLPLSEIIKTTTVSTATVSISVPSTSNVLYIDNISNATDLGFPLKAQVGQIVLIFSGVNSTNDGLIVDPTFGVGASQGTVQINHTAGENIYFIYEPKIRCVCGLPITTPFLPSNPNDASSFTYYPNIPADWLPIAKCVVQFVSGPPLTVHIPDDTVGILRTAYEWPEPDSTNPILAPDDALTLLQYLKKTQAAATQFTTSVNVSNLIQSLIKYTQAISNDPKLSFQQYWSKRPFYPVNNFLIGVGFDNLQRLEFSDNFAKAFYKSTGGQDVQHTFAIFRGDMYNITSAYINANIPVSDNNTGGVSALNIIQAGPMPSLLAQGAYTYAVTVITDKGESAPITLNAQTYDIKGAFYNDVEWVKAIGSPNPNILYYHIARRSNFSGDQSYYRLTSDGEITAAPIYNMHFTPSVKVDKYLDSNSEAFVIIPSTNGYLGGIEIQLKQDIAYAPADKNAKISIELWSDTSGVPNTKIASGTHDIIYSMLTLNYQKFLIPLSYVTTGTILNANTQYWVVLKHSDAAPLVGHRGIDILTQASGNNLYALSSDNVIWSTVNNVQPYFKGYGFIDDGTRTTTLTTRRGVKLTGNIALKPSILRVYVPSLVLPTSLGMTPNLTNNTTLYVQNDLVVSVTARLGENGTPKTLQVTVPKGSLRDMAYPLSSNPLDVFDRVDDVQVNPGGNLSLGYGGSGIQWSIADMITVETTP